MFLTNKDAYEILFRKSRYSQALYCCIISLFLIIFFILPILRIPVYIKSAGVFQSSDNRIVITAPFSGEITSFNAIDNKQIAIKAPLFMLDTTSAHNQLQTLYNRISLSTNIRNDLGAMLRNLDEFARTKPTLKTDICRTRWRQFIAEAERQSDIVSHERQIYLRHKILYNRQVLTQAEFEEHTFDYQQKLLDSSAIFKRYSREWEQDYNHYIEEVETINTDIKQGKRTLAQYSIVSPATGSIQNIAGVKIGSWVHERQPILEISPNNLLYGLILVRSADITSIKIGQLVSIRIDAFRSNKFGLRTAVVIDVSDDTVVANNEMFYKITCQLNDKDSKLIEQPIITLKKGMTFMASFLIGKRTVFQLLFKNSNK